MGGAKLRALVKAARRRQEPRRGAARRENAGVTNSSGHTTHTKPGSALDRLAVGTSLVLAALLWAGHLRAAPEATGLFHDGGVYLVTARALAAGTGYRRASLPDAPAEVRYPPLFPLALSSVWRVAPRFPDNLRLLKGLGLVAATGLVLLLPGYLRSIGFSPHVATSTAALTALAPLTTRYATAIAAELPFALLALGALWATERAAGTERRRIGFAALAGGLAGLAFLTRTMGAAVVAGGVAVLASRTGARKTAAYALAAAACCLPWLAWVTRHTSTAGGLDYLSALASDGVPGPHSLAAHLVRLPAAVAVVTIPGLADLLPAAPPAPIAVAAYAGGLLALVSALARPFGAYVAATVGLAVAVPWFQPRFLVPLAPLFLAALLARVLPAGPGRSRGTWRAAVVVGLLAGALLGQRARLAAVTASGLPALEQASLDGLRWHDLQAALAWLDANTAPGDVLASFHDPLVHLYTGRPAVQAYPALWHPDPAQVSAALAAGNARYLVDIPRPSGGPWDAAEDAWRRWLATHEGVLTPVWAGGPVRVWRIDGPADT